ncbi:multiple sugar transport system permease protein [Enhydrobacter aerosaccus]|uniref:Multiple sugar transport system permease protein n=1 Tax=Enhydrobacter aerosaccus TaxID=225324 RepID=A0A1T4PMW7_9HYPH|nr:carbohydrate ABC transporter permease [Enhydrobacter aerosaccus]SJZ92809.1 multiple sugar transport system permease protein [Enhydrobacter aerosaccus]
MTPRTRRRIRRLADRTALGLSVAVLLAPCLFVFFWMVSLSVKYDIDNTAWPPVFWPEQMTFENFKKVFEESPMFLYFWNSVQVTGSATLVSLLLGVPAGYGIAKAKANRMAGVLLLSRMTPGLSYLIPLFTLFQIIGLIGTVWPIALTHLVITLPIVVWIMIGFFETQPHELEEAARIDGATLWQAFRYVALPLARPGIVVGAILSFITSWNNFIFGAVFAGRTTRTMPVAVYNMLTFESFAWGPLAAAAIVVMLPVILLTIVIQKEIVQGLSTGGVK